MNSEDQENTTYEIKLDENMNKILQAIGGMRQEFSDRFDKIEREQAESKQEFAEFKQEFAEFKVFVESQLEQFPEFKEFVEAQFEAIRQGLVQSHTEYNQLVSEISQNRSAIFSVKASVSELQEQMYQLTKNRSQPI